MARKSLEWVAEPAAASAAGPQVHHSQVALDTAGIGWKLMLTSLRTPHGRDVHTGRPRHQHVSLSSESQILAPLVQGRLHSRSPLRPLEHHLVLTPLAPAPQWQTELLGTERQPGQAPHFHAQLQVRPQPRARRPFPRPESGDWLTQLGESRHCRAEATAPSV